MFVVSGVRVVHPQEACGSDAYSMINRKDALVVPLVHI